MPDAGFLAVETATEKGFREKATVDLACGSCATDQKTSEACCRGVIGGELVDLILGCSFGRAEY